MRALLFILSLSFLFSVTTFGQTESRLEKYLRYEDPGRTGEFFLIHETSYKYNEIGEVSEQHQKIYNEDGSLKNWYGRFYTYSDQNLLVEVSQQRYNPDVNLWITLSWVENTYDDLGCLIGEKKTRNVGGLYEEVKYERDDACRITKHSVWRDTDVTPGLEIQSMYEIEYMDDDISYVQKIYKKSISDTMYISSKIHFEYDEDENLKERFQVGFYEDKDTFYLSKRLYDYDEHQNITACFKYSKYPLYEDWKLLSEFFYYNQYNDENELVELRTEELIYNTDPPSNDPLDDKLYQYEYTCDDLEKVQTVISYGSNIRYESYYEGENDCFEIEKIDLNIEVYPNPSEGLLNIKSPIFGSGNTQITVFSIDGKVLLEKNEITRCELVRLDLSGLPSGIYIVELSNENHFTNKKVVINNSQQ